MESLRTKLQNRIRFMFAVLVAAVYNSSLDAVAVLLRLFKGSARSQLFRDTHAKIDPADIIILGIAFFVIAYMLPLGITAILNVDTSRWDPSLATLWKVLFPALGIFVVILYLVREVQS